LIVVDDHALILEAVQLAVRDVDDIELVGTAASGRELLGLLPRLEPDVVLLDLVLPGMDGLACLDHLREQHPRVKVVVLSAVDDAHVIGEALRRGACSFITKSVDPRDLVSIIRIAAEGTVFTQPAPAAFETEPAELGQLTPKEHEVLDCLARGLTNRQIALELDLAELTVKFHLTHIYRKLGVANRTEAAGLAHSLGSRRAESVRQL
jgi:DNA-binding NarL/FixJ family response regulator